ncbi:hypothetical protein B0H19DRAFT_1145984 [Mycena capillaripes]|nr:hypothetical protein B0H19DRAFT_1145984 [Mycena capillaripes]
MPPRMDHPTPLDIPELLEHCIDYLHDSPRDLKACALVSRHWVYPSQSHLFRAPTVTSRNGIVSVNDAPWERLRDMLALSSHLIRHIQSFNIEGLEAHSSTLHQICYFPFTHLTSVSISIVVFSEARLAIQQLLSLPTLRRVKLGCMFLDCEGYMRVWDRCSPTICHIYLDSKVQGSFSGSPPVATSLTTPLVLESLRIESEPDQVLGYCDSRLFDFSHLKVLSIGRSSLPNFIASVSFAPALGTIQALDISEDFYVRLSPVALFISSMSFTGVCEHGGHFRVSKACAVAHWDNEMGHQQTDSSISVHHRRLERPSNNHPCPYQRLTVIRDLRAARHSIVYHTYGTTAHRGVRDRSPGL